MFFFFVSARRFVVLTRQNRFYQRIDRAYAYANRTLLDLLIHSQSLLPRLRSLKHHFFLDQGDSFTHFLDLASHELNKKAKHVSMTKLQSLLDVAIRNPSSASSSDPYKEDVKVAMASTTLTDWLMKIVNVSGALGGEEGGMEGLFEASPDVGGGREKKEEGGDRPLTGGWAHVGGKR
jgi:gamma-tubulin complex component 2